MMKPIYLDHAATTPIHPEVLDAMMPYLTTHQGNPSSYHQPGIESRKAINTARKSMALMMGCSPDELFFTSGGTESTNLALKGIYEHATTSKHIITSKVEHKATVETLKYLEKRGAKITWLDVDHHGQIDPAQIEAAIQDDTLLVSLIWANNEIGTIMDIQAISEITKRHGVLLHVDAVQVIGQIPFDLSELSIDLFTFSAHKFHGPKGIGGLYVKKGTPLMPLIHGGGQEYGLRSGTEHLAGIIGLDQAMQLALSDLPLKIRHKRALTEKLYQYLMQHHEIQLTGAPIGDKRLAGHLSIAFKNEKGFDLAFALDQKGIYVSTGSACSANAIEPSHVLTAIGTHPDYIHGNLRITIGNETTADEIDRVIKAFQDIL